MVDHDVVRVIANPQGMGFIRQVPHSNANVLYDHIVCIHDHAGPANQDSWRRRGLSGNRDVGVSNVQGPVVPIEWSR